MKTSPYVFTLCKLIFFFYTCLSFSQPSNTEAISSQEINIYQKTIIDAETTAAQINALNLTTMSNRELLEKYRTTNTLWKQLAQNTFELFKLDELLSFELPNTDNNQEVKSSLEVLPKLSKARASIITQLLINDEHQFLSLNKDYIETVSLEVRTVPYRWYSIFYFGYIRLKTDFQGSAEHFKSFLGQVFSLFLLFLTYYLAWKYYPRLDLRLQNERQKYIKKAYMDPAARSAALWIERLRPFLPWIIILFICNLSKQFIAASYFPELILFVPYIGLYAYFRIFKLVLALGLGKLSRLSGVARDAELRLKIEQSSRWISNSIFISLVCLHSVQSTLYNGILNYEISRITDIIIIFFILLVIRKWREEIAKLVEEQASTKIGKKLAAECRGKRSLLFAPIGAIIAALILISDYIFEWVQGFDFGKKIAALLFKQKISALKTESNKDFRKKAPERYKKEFLRPQYIEVPNLFEMELSILEQDLNNWKEALDMNNSIAVIGDIGIGKSYFTEKVIELAQSGFHIHKMKFSEKYLEPDFFEKSIRQEFGKTQSEENKAHLFLMDEAENLFLSKVGGFEAIKKCFELLSSEKENVFWVLSFNTPSWLYLNSVLKKDHLFSRVIELPSWSERQIQYLIEARHKQTENFSISFDEILSATKGDTPYEVDEHIEEKFYHLLTEESKGNPSCAIQIWPSCLRIGSSEELLIVGLPQERSNSSIQSLNDTCLFLLASIIKHGELKPSEMAQVTEFSDDIIRSSLKQILLKGLIVKSELGSYSIHPLWLYKLDNFLEGKNFLYGN